MLHEVVVILGPSSPSLARPPPPARPQSLNKSRERLDHVQSSTAPHQRELNTDLKLWLGGANTRSRHYIRDLALAASFGLFILPALAEPVDYAVPGTVMGAPYARWKRGLQMPVACGWLLRYCR